nr:hypothetical protein [Polymorphobacter sp.]
MVAAFILRLGLAKCSAEAMATAETRHVAITLLTTGRFAGAFHVGGAATAHLSPVMPGVIAAAYSLFGVATPLGDTVLRVLSIGLVELGIWLCFLIFGELGVARPVRLAALAVAVLLPIQFSLEVCELALWEAPIGLVTLFAVLLACVRLDKRPTLDWTALLGPIGGAAVLVVISPAIALGALSAIALLTIRRLPFRRWPLVALVTATAVLAVSLPWALRNEAVLGRMIWTRSNANLEMAVAYNDTLLKVPDQRRAYQQRLAEIHPTAGARGFAAMTAAGGEVAYNDLLGRQTHAWMAANPEGTVTLIERHIREYLVPPGWFFSTFGNAIAAGGGARGAVIGVILFFALFGGGLVAVRDRRILYVVAPLVVMILPYIVVQPILRYRYLVYTLSIFIAFDVAARLWRYVHGRRTAPAAA